MFREIGTTGLSRWGGTIDEEFLPELQGHWRANKIYKEMSSNDPTVGAILFAFEMILRETEWAVEPTEANAVDQEAADFIAECMHDMSSSWGDVVSEILSMLTYGWSYHEVVYKRRSGANRDHGKSSRYSDGRIGWRKMPIRSQDSLDEWVFDDAGGIRGLKQRSPTSNEIIFVPIEKALLFRIRSRKNDPQGQSLLRNAYRPWHFKKHMETIEGIGVERDLAGLPKGYAPPEWFHPEATAAQKKQLADMERVLKSIRRDEQAAILIPKIVDPETGERLLDVELMSSAGSREQNVHEIIQRKSQEIAMTILADVILLGHEKVGSLALATSKSELLNTALNSILQSIADVLNRHEVPRLLQMNGMQGQAEMRPTPIENTNLEALGTFITNLSGAGAQLFPDDALENHLRSVGGMPRREDAADR